MRDIDQKILDFKYDKNFQDHDFYLSKSNRHIYETLENSFNKYFFKKIQWHKV